MKKLMLTIPQSCHQDWDAMTPTEKGKFCNACEKTVVDFMSMSDTQLVQYFKSKFGDVCGRLHPDQLNREIQLPRKRMYWLRYLLPVSLPAFLLSMKLQAQGKKNSHPIAVAQNKVASKNTSKKQRAERVPAGNVLKHSKDSLAQQVQIQLKPEMRSPIEISTQLQIIAGMVSVVPDRSCKKSRKRDDVNMINQIKDSIAYLFTGTSGIQVYPNPAPTGQVIQVQLKNIQKGDYLVQLIHANGIVVDNKTWTVVQKQEKREDLLAGMIPGMYIIILQHGKKQKKYQQQFIVN